MVEGTSRSRTTAASEKTLRQRKEQGGRRNMTAITNQG